MNHEIKKLVNSLPEIYQPIYGLEYEYADKASRPCQDRFTILSHPIGALSKKLNRPLKILDIGCAQGFFSFNFAELGHHVHGVDALPANIALCQSIAKNNPNLKADFEVGRAEKIINEIKNYKYDVILCLSVLHHLTHEQGIDFVKKIILTACSKTSLCLIELALKEEPVYWANSLPFSPREYFNDISFVHELGIAPTHLSKVKRPIFFASNSWLYIPNHLHHRKDFHHAPNPFTSERNRSIIITDDLVIKHSGKGTFYADSYYNELKNEINFLKSTPINFDAPKLHSYKISDDECWLVRDKLKGENLYNIFSHLQQNQLDLIITEVLNQLIILEENGYYHNDLRIWNILIDNNSVKLIDFGAIETSPIDCVWPFHVYLSFFTFIKELYDNDNKYISIYRPAWISPFNLPNSYLKRLYPLWNIPIKYWSFIKIKEMLDKNISQSSIEQTPNEIWIEKIEHLLTTHSSKITSIDSEINKLQNIINNSPYFKAKKKVGRIIKKCSDNLFKIKKYFQVTSSPSLDIQNQSIVYIDCTDLIQSEFNSGIQRVVRNIINNRHKSEKLLKWTIQPVFFHKKLGFIKVQGCSKDDLKQNVGYFIYIDSCKSGLRRVRKNLKLIVPNKPFHNWVDRIWKTNCRWAISTLTILFLYPIIFLSSLLSFFNKPNSIWKPTYGDTFIIPGSSWWNNPNIFSGLNIILSKNGKIITLIHDLIPISHPDLFTDENCINFRNGLSKIIDSTDLFVAVSETTRNTLKEYINNNNIPYKGKSVSFRLGADLDLIENNSTIRPSIRCFFDKCNPYIVVGTVEPRKNHEFVLDIFESLWSKGFNCKLCIIGMLGWKCETVADRIMNHHLANKKLFWYKDLNDMELSFSYKKAKALIYPSIIEGFGLPLVEALHNKCPVIASDTTIFREIGGSSCTYFSLTNPEDLENIIIEIEQDGLAAKKQLLQDKSFRWNNWEQSSLEFYDIIYSHLQQNVIDQKST